MKQQKEICIICCEMLASFYKVRQILE